MNQLKHAKGLAPTCINVSAEIKGEIGLLYAIIERTILDAVGKYTEDSDYPQRSAILWLQSSSEDDNLDSMSFEYCCQHLEICPIRTRKSIFKFIKEYVAGDSWSRTTWQTIVNMMSDDDNNESYEDDMDSISETISVWSAWGGFKDRQIK